MEPKALAQALEVLAVMRECELAVKELYEVCARTWPESADFWNAIAAQEARHSEHMERMAAIIKARPAGFEPGRPFNPVALRTFIKGVAWNRDRVRQGGLDYAQALFVAKDIENSLIDNRIPEMVRTQDAEFLDLARKVADDTACHCRQMDERLAQPKK